MVGGGVPTRRFGRQPLREHHLRDELQPLRDHALHAQLVRQPLREHHLWDELQPLIQGRDRQGRREAHTPSVPRLKSSDAVVRG